MPIYEYRCEQCGHQSEEMRRLTDPPLTVCPNCGGTYTKLVSAPAFQFKGSGWYVTDYGKGGVKPGSEASGEKADGAAAAKSAGSGGAEAGGKSEKGEKAAKPAPAESGAKAEKPAFKTSGEP